MSFRKKNKSYNRTIMIKRAIQVDDELRNWIFTNSNYRRKVWNDFVAEYYRCRNNGEKFDVVKYKSWYFHNVEEPNHSYDTHVVGISEQVMKDMMLGLKVAKGNGGKLRFHKFDRFKCSFGVGCNPQFVPQKTMHCTRFNSRVYLGYDDFIMFRDHGGHFTYVKLKEPIFHDITLVSGSFFYRDKNHYYAFSQEDIKSISFIHELGKFYVCLSIGVLGTYSKKVHENHVRRNAAGIDLGIHNPVSIYDNTFYSIRMDERVIRKLHYLERRARRLQHIMDRKKYMSKNYIKVNRKFRVTWYKIVNLRKEWRRKLSKTIALTYNTICVDGYTTPTVFENNNLSGNDVRFINHYNRMHGMFRFHQTLEHACWKYHTKYIPSPNNTTRTCSKCGYVNAHLPLSQRTFRCGYCGYTVDRDQNAAQNCYAYLLA